MVLIKDNASLPPASAAFAISVISVTFGESFIIIGCFALALISFVISKRLSGFCPKAIPPCFTFGHETLISNISTGWSPNFSTTST